MAAEATCLACNLALLQNETAITCCECEYVYHLGTCSTITLGDYNSKSENQRKKWCCATCTTAKQRSSQSTKQKKKSESDVPAMLVSINEKIDSLLGLKDTVDGIESAIQMLSGKYDEILNHIRRQDSDIKELKSRIDKIETLNTTAEVQQLKRELNEMEWRSRRLNLEIHGVPPVENENLLARVNEIGAKLQLPQLDTADIVNTHSLPSKPGKIPGIIVRFVRQPQRDQWLEKKRPTEAWPREHLFSRKPDEAKQSSTLGNQRMG